MLSHASLSLSRDESLTVRRTSNATYEAVVKGFLDDSCAPRVVSPHEELRDGDAFLFSTPLLPWPPCVMPLLPPLEYEASVSLGSLESGDYELIWQQEGFFAGSVSFSVPEYSVFYESFEAH